MEVFPNYDLSDNAALRRFVQAVQSIAPQATDTPVSLLEGGNVVVNACIQATVITLIGAMVILLACAFAEFEMLY